MRFNDWPVYVPVAKRREQARKRLEKMKKQGIAVQPVRLSGRRIAASFWGKGWCDHVESFSDYANRLPRGRSYVRNGSVCHLEIKGGAIDAIVSGSQLYNVSIEISPLKKTKWEALKRSCSGRIGSLIDLLRGRLDAGVMEVVTHRKEGLFPLAGEMKFDCDCPDWAGMCKHVAAVLYGVGARLDDSPEMLFLLRGVDHAELVDISEAVTEVAKGGSSRRRLQAGGIADIFGIDLADPIAPPEAAAQQGEESRQARQEVPAAARDARYPVARPKPGKKSREEKAAGTQAEAAGTKTKPTGKTPAAARVAKPARAVAAASVQPRKKPATAVVDTFPDPLTGDAIRAWRSYLGESQASFAARIGASAAAISQWEKKGDAELSMFPTYLQALKKAWKKTR